MRGQRLFSWEKRRTMGNLFNLSNYLKENAKAIEPGGFQGYTGTKGNRQKMKHREFPPNIKVLYCKCDQALGEVAQRCCGVSLLGDIQKPSGHGPGHPNMVQGIQLFEQGELD